MRSQLARLGFAVVHGRSMLPTLREGDRLLVRYAGPARVGRVVVVRLPEGVIAVKRVTATNSTDVIIESDNAVEGFAGSVPRGDVEAVVLARLWPRPRLLR